MRTVGIFEAKAQLSQLIQAVEEGEEVVLTRHGHAVARLVPPAGQDQARLSRNWSAELREYRKGRDLGAKRGATLQELIAAGKR